MKARNGFTLVEILIVVVILGILAAIVIPQFTEASNEARMSSLVSDLQTVRSQIELYKIQHTDALPGAFSGTVTPAMALTMYSNAAGDTSVAQQPDVGIFGPYLQKIPTNPFATDYGDQIVSAATSPDPNDGGTDDPGWFFNTVTGAFGANTVGHTGL
ncbi:MAG: prepilin-type N-terminal cleavage/methylation domain-containing protein [Planctomycetes bacterium]|nr:prepilin-type N-terminal cleavage/methylation domain-containing protein [Planctomycetota bacterium]